VPSSLVPQWREFFFWPRAFFGKNSPVTKKYFSSLQSCKQPAFPLPVSLRGSLQNLRRRAGAPAFRSHVVEFNQPRYLVPV